MMISVGIEFAVGVACLALFPIRRPDQWLPVRAKPSTSAHAAFGGVLAIAAVAIVLTVASNQRLWASARRPASSAPVRCGRRHALRVAPLEAGRHGGDAWSGRSRGLLRLPHSLSRNPSHRHPRRTAPGASSPIRRVTYSVPVACGFSFNPSGSLESIPHRRKTSDRSSCPRRAFRRTRDQGIDARHMSKAGSRGLRTQRMT